MTSAIEKKKRDDALSVKKTNLKGGRRWLEIAILLSCCLCLSSAPGSMPFMYSFKTVKETFQSWKGSNQLHKQTLCHKSQAHVRTAQFRFESFHWLWLLQRYDVPATKMPSWTSNLQVLAVLNVVPLACIVRNKNKQGTTNFKVAMRQVRCHAQKPNICTRNKRGSKATSECRVSVQLSAHGLNWRAHLMRPVGEGGTTNGSTTFHP